jgi:hypothetical protein
MTAFVLFVDFLGLGLAAVGFCMAFRQDFVRDLFGVQPKPGEQLQGQDSGGDPLTYILRISGTMIMVFGIAIAGMITVFNIV